MQDNGLESLAFEKDLRFINIKDIKFLKMNMEVEMKMQKILWCKGLQSNCMDKKIVLN